MSDVNIDQMVKHIWTYISAKIQQSCMTGDVYIMCGLCVILLLVLNLGIVGMIISTVVGIVYPLIKTHNCIKEGSVEKLSSMVYYWMIYGIVVTLELLLGNIFQSIPFYFVCKTIFLILCVVNDDIPISLYRKLAEHFLKDVEHIKMEKLFSIVTSKIAEGVKEFKEA